MAEKKHQHYVPKFYMRNFANPKGLFMIHQISTQKTIGPVSYKSQCYENYFYGEDVVWENKLGEMESKWGVAFQDIIAKKALTCADIHAIKQFAMYQRQRTVAESKYRKQEHADILLECGKMLYAEKGWAFNREAEKICKERAENECTPSENLEIANRLINLIDDLSIVILQYNTKKGLISSDVPVVAINQFHSPSIGYSCMGLILLFPISPHQLVVLYDAKMYPRFDGVLYAESGDENEVSHLNTLQLISAEKILFSYPGEGSFTFTDSEWESRKINREHGALSTLGSGKNKLFVSSMRKTIYRCELSFGQVGHRFKRIPFVCKEAPPRTKDRKWEEKLNMKADLLVDLSKAFPQILTDNKVSRKELRRGCQRMASATSAYWNQNK